LKQRGHLYGCCFLSFEGSKLHSTQQLVTASIIIITYYSNLNFEKQEFEFQASTRAVAFATAELEQKPLTSVVCMVDTTNNDGM
jgi:hypothetical protein